MSCLLRGRCADDVCLDFRSLSPSVHDGWGVTPEKGIKGNAIENADTTSMDHIATTHNHTLLKAHGLAVGLSDGLMGNSEVGSVLAFPRNLAGQAGSHLVYP